MQIASLAMVAPVAALPPPTETWLQARTRNFTLLGNTTGPVLENLARELEQFHAVLDHEDLGATRSVRPMATFIVFRDDYAFGAYKRGRDGKPQTVAGMCATTKYGTFIGMRADLGYNNRRIVFHEYVHDVLDRRWAGIPTWLNEGIAEFYSTFRLHAGTVEIGLPVPEHVGLLRGTNLIPLPELFAIDRQSKAYNEGTRRGVFYAQSWALYHYMVIERPELSNKLKAYIDNPSRHLDASAAFDTAFGVPAGQMTVELERYVHRAGLASRRIPFGETPVQVSIALEAISRADVLYQLAEYLAHTAGWNRDEAAAHAQAALAADSTHARAMALLGWLRARAAADAEAEGLFEHATTLAPDDDQVLFLRGMSNLEGYFDAHQSLPLHPRELPSQLRSARAAFMRCLELSPRRAETHAGLGRTYLLEPGDVRAGITALERALWDLPSRPDIAFDLMFLHIRNGDRAAANAVFETYLERAPDPAARDQARALLEGDPSGP